MIINFKELNKYYKKNGLYYDENLLLNIQVSLKTKPFLILSGISGTGKSKIVDIYSDYVANAMNYKKNYSLIPVRPNWVDNKFIFGFHNIIDDTYSITPIIKIFIEALQNRDKPYFIMLDEMNMAKVEHYFSDFLSVLESRKKKTIKFEEIKDIEIFQQYFKYIRKGFATSYSIILSALDMDPNVAYEVEELRNNRFSRVAGIVSEKVDYSGKQIQGNWFAQYRSELNQGQNRLANRLFDVVGSKYQLKNINQIQNADDKKILEDLRAQHRLMSKILEDYNITSAFVESNNDTLEYVEADYLNLHNNNNVLPISSMNNDNYLMIQENIKNEMLSLGDLSYSNHLYDAEMDTYYVPPSLPIPKNVYVIGTVNIDETTHAFSNKVLDRANVIEFNEVDIFKALDASSKNYSSFYLKNFDIDININLSTLEDTHWLYLHHKDCFDVLHETFKILESENLHFGYRTYNEISSYIKNYLSYSHGKALIPLDNQLLQKILPKINGDIEELNEVLDNLLQLTINYKLEKSELKLRRMILDLKRNGFTTFIK